jgi:two-component system, OmpR family, heavy metal sensor histidine kinase CusS
MRSIRLSLVGSFLLLLAVALGAVSLLVYRIAEESQRGKQASERELLLERAKDNRVEEATKLDNDLLAKAHLLASQAQWQFAWQRGSDQDYLPLALLTASLVPNGHITGPLFFCEGHHSTKIGDLLLMMTVNRISFEQTSPPREDRFFQINTKWVDWHSRSMGDMSFQYDPQVEERMKPFEHFFDDTELPNGVSLRRVSLKAPAYRVQHIRPPRRGFRQARNPPPPPSTEKVTKPPQTETIDPPPLIFFIQAASTTTDRDQAIAAIDETIQSDLEDLEAQSKVAMADLRNRLLLISLATFALTVLGGFWLVRLGLHPLNHLSEAVSQVSERDFHLPMDDKRLPAELKPIVERLTTTLEQLRRAFDREKQAAADISHELRTPLAAMLTTLDLALRKPRSGEEYRELLQDCRVSGQQMSQLVERLLTLARLDAGVDNVRPLELDATGLADQCATLVRPLADARGLSLRVHHDKPVLITADPNKLREVVTNLLHNAIQYNRPNGRIDLKVGRKNGSLEMIVEDTGIGINPEARSHIFERFYRADPSRHADGLHAGLGLSIVKGFVDLMGGSISVESTEGVGSAFRVQLPIRNGREGAKA